MLEFEGLGCCPVPQMLCSFAFVVDFVAASLTQMLFAVLAKLC